MIDLLHRFFGLAPGDLLDLRFGFAPVWGWGWAIPLVAVLFVAGVLFVRTVHRHALPGVKGYLIGIRIAVVAVLVLLALNPVLTGYRVEPGTQFLAVLYDNSLSMTLPDADGKSRGEHLEAWLQMHREDFLERLGQKWHVVQYGVGQSLRRLPDPTALNFAERESNLHGAIAQAERDLQGATLAGVVLFSDGVEQPFQPAEALADLTTPVYTVGVGTTGTEQDLALENVAVAATHFDDNPFAITARGAAHNLEGEALIVEVVEGNRVLASRTVPVERDTFQYQTRLELMPDTKDFTVCKVRVRLARSGAVAPDAPDEKLAVAGYDPVFQNNLQPVLLDNRKREFRVLYFGGRPNWEHKFLQRALEEDEQLRLASVIRISGAERKFEYRGNKTSLQNPLFEGFDPNEVQAPRYDEAVFIRLGLGADELADGYPLDANALFPYHLIILGEVEHEFFTSAHLETTREAVTRRGASLLLLGGADAYTDGGYRGSMLEDMLPVMLPGKARSPEAQETAYAVSPTSDGFLSGVWVLNPDPEINAQQWAALAPLFGLHRFPMTRVGATVWADAHLQGDDGETATGPFFAVQRYGAGKVAALAAGETWPWQLESGSQDTSHERFWRQVIRALVHDAPEQIARQVSNASPTAWTTTPLRYTIRDGVYKARSDLLAGLEVATPSGDRLNLALEERLDQPGVYGASLEPAESGMYRIQVAAREESGDPVGTLEDAIYVQADTREYASVMPDPENLAALADKTGGFHVSLDNAGTLADRIPYQVGTDNARVTVPLWHHALWLVLLAALLCVDWYLRRTRGMA